MVNTPTIRIYPVGTKLPSWPIPHSTAIDFGEVSPLPPEPAADRVRRTFVQTHFTTQEEEIGHRKSLTRKNTSIFYFIFYF